MIVNVICAAIEAFAQMSICFGIFIKAYGKEERLNKSYKILTTILIIIVYASKTFNNVINVFSISVVSVEIPVIAVILWLIVREGFLRTIAWCVFSIMTFVILKLPILVIIGLISDEPLANILVRNSQVWSRIANSILLIVIFLVYYKKSEFVVKHLKKLSHQKFVLLFIGAIEYVIVIYIMNIGWHGFTIHTFILTLCLILMLFLLIVCLIVILEYHIMVRLNLLLKSKENNLKKDYALLNQEIERNRKINHDNKHDMEYLYNCFKQKDYNSGMNYIEHKERHYILIQKNSVWTGHGSIDFLINRAKAQADEKKILFTIEVDIVEIPIEEYDFFSVLSNLLDNAIEASSQNNEGEGRITLQILSLNNVFKLKIENTYLIEPDKRGKHFVSGKEDKELHGWGIENVKEVVSRYDGEIDIKYGNGIFLVVIILIK